MSDTKKFSAKVEQQWFALIKENRDSNPRSNGANNGLTKALNAAGKQLVVDLAKARDGWNQAIDRCIAANDKRNALMDEVSALKAECDRAHQMRENAIKEARIAEAEVERKELEAQVRTLTEALERTIEFLRHSEWDSHSTEAHVGNLIEDARAALAPKEQAAQKDGE